MAIASNVLQKVIQIVLRKRKNCAVQYLNYGNYVSFSWWDQGQIGIKLGTKHVTYLKLESFTQNKDVYVSRLESVFYDM